MGAYFSLGKLGRIQGGSKPGGACQTDGPGVSWEIGVVLIPNRSNRFARSHGLGDPSVDLKQPLVPFN